MPSFRIESANGPYAIEFFDRDPPEPRSAEFTCWVRLTGPGLSAERRLLFDDYQLLPPTDLFRRMAESWKGWDGAIEWGGYDDGDVSIRCTQDRTGHVCIRVTMPRGRDEWGWVVECSIMAEAGQLDDIARRAEAFFGATLVAT